MGPIARSLREMTKAIRIYAWATAGVMVLASVAVRRIALDLKAYMDSLLAGEAYPPVSELGFAITPWLGVLPLGLMCFLVVAHCRKFSHKAVIHVWGSTCLIFLMGLLLAFVAYTVPWVPVVSRLDP